MELLFIEVIVWLALACLFWALRQNLVDIEQEIQQVQALKRREIASLALARRFVRPDAVGEPVGQYQNCPIHDSVVYHGERYRFDYVCPPELKPLLRNDQCYVQPGIVYSRTDSANAERLEG